MMKGFIVLFTAVLTSRSKILGAGVWGSGIKIPAPDQKSFALKGFPMAS